MSEASRFAETLRCSGVVAVCVLVNTVAATSSDGRLVAGFQQPPAALRSGINLVTIDVQIAPVKDAPLRDLTAADFDIGIAGRKRLTASATLLHYDEGTVTRDPRIPPSDAGTSPACVFGFHRKTDRPTAHDLVGVERNDADRKEVKQVRVNMVDKAFAVQGYVWRSPVKRSASPPDAK
jgi:hypothetical protein